MQTLQEAPLVRRPLAVNASEPATLQWLFAATVFVGAFLLFLIQPLLSNRLLPWYGGSAAVWSVCVLFFQTGLCAGYAYAHASERYLRPVVRRNLLLALLAAACVVYPATLMHLWRPADMQMPGLEILIFLTASIGLPYLVLSATSPLLQAWFAEQFPRTSPYRLYALSNVGALLALLGYLLVVDPLLALRQQIVVWFVGFLCFVALMTCSAIATSRRRPAHGSAPANTRETIESAASAVTAPSWTRRFVWLFLSALTSTMLLATTNHLCQDVASIPLLWIAPLGLFLLSFILAFDHPRWYRRLPMSMAALVALYLAAGLDHPSSWATARWLYETRAWLLGVNLEPWNPQLGLRTELLVYLAALFSVCFVCNGELYRLRPATSHLTEYFLLISIGGALGGLFVNFVAPLVFNRYWEWQIGLVGGYVIAMFLAFGWPALQRRGQPGTPEGSSGKFRWRGVALAGGMVVAVAALVEMVQSMVPTPSASQTVLAATRNFYGVLRVVERGGGDPTTRDRALYHGRILHGIQLQDPARQDWPTTYYTENSGAGRVWSNAGGRPDFRVGVIGMGVGTMAAYAQRGQTIRFYEINPEIVRIADAQFSYLEHARARGANVEVALGDARQVSRRELADHSQKFDLLVLDAFSGDSIPNHLLTKEAFEVYLQHLAPDGTIAAHVTNQYLDVPSVVIGIAAALGLEPICIETPVYPQRAMAHSEWVVLTRDPKLQATLSEHAQPVQRDSDRPLPLWTDDHHNMLSILR